MAHSRTRRPEDLTPLTEVAFEVMISLALGPLHGYALMSAVRERTAGRVRLHPGTLYRAVARMVEEELLVERTAGDRRTYELTSFGRRVAESEARRLRRQLEAAAAHRLVAAKPRG